MDLDIIKTAALFGIPAAATAIGFTASGLLSKAVNPKTRPIALSDFLTWSEVLEDSATVRNIDGSCFRVLRLGGTVYSGLNTNLINIITEKRKDWFFSLKEKGISLRFHSAHKSAAIPLSRLGEGILQDINQTWADYMAHTYTTAHYVFLSVPSEEKITHLEQACQDARTYLDEHSPVVLSNDDDINGNSPLLSFLYSLLNGRHGLVAPVRQNLAHALTTSYVEPTLDGDIILHHATATERVAVLSLSAIGAGTDRTILSSLFSLKAEFDLLIRAKLLNSSSATYRTNYRKNQSKFPVPNAAIVDEWEEIESLIQQNKETIVQASLHLIVKGKDETELNRSISAIEETLAKHRYKVVREKDMAWRIYCSRLPGFEFDSRLRDYLTSHLADLTPFSTTPTGNTRSLFGPYPIRYMPTAGQQAAYALTYHPTEGDDSSPHDIYFAPTRSGKTVFLSFLLSGAMAVHEDMAAILFDRNQGLRVWTAFVNGSYLWPERADMPLNFFDNDGNEADRRLAETMLSLMSGLDDNQSLKQIAFIVQDIYSYENRRKRILRDLFKEVVPAGPLRDALQPWAEHSRYANIFNGDYDAFDPAISRITTVALDNVIDDPKLAGILSYYKMRRFQNAYVELGRPYKFIVDEASTLLAEESIAKLVMSEIRTAAKNRGAVTTIWQDVSGLWASPVGDALAKNTGSFYFWPGSASRVEDLAFFNMTETEQDFALGRWRPDGSVRPVMIKRENETVFLETNLQPLGDLINVFRGGVGPNKWMEECKKRSGTDWQRDFLSSSLQAESSQSQDTPTPSP
jgi:type IV secretion system protein VirB4